MLTRKSRVLSCPSEDSRSSALVCVRVVALADPGTVDALVAMQSNFDVESTVMTRRLVEVRKNYLIPLEYELHAPLPREHPYDIFLNGFSLSTDALKMGLMFPLFPTEWTSRMVNNLVPTLLVNETELAKIFWGILSASKGVKDMNEA
ncbi:hypothetical protein BHM03_00012992 [Ensete ventricosum]|nr:hypothetical protein BHM03_00012992 [Ensete ventricosum]